MQLASRPWITAGVALVGASAIAAAPVAAPLPVVHVPAIQLASFDDIPWQDVFSNADTSFTNNILDPFTGAPFPALQQVIFNQAEYLADIWKDISTGNFSNLGTTFSTIGTDITNHLTAALSAPIDSFSPTGTESYLLPSLDSTPVTVGFSVQACSSLGCAGFSPTIDLGGHAALLNDLIHGLPIELNFGALGTINFGTINILSDLLGSTTAAEVLPLLNLVASPLSGVLWGLAGTALSPLAQLVDDGVHTFDALSTQDYTTAFDDLLNVPANVTNAFLEGYGNANNLLADFGLSLPGFTPELDLGGLLSPAGSLFNAVGFDLGASSSTTVLGVTWSASAFLNDPATTVGPIGSLLELGQAIAQSIGWDDIGNQLSGLASLF
jgi:hypothetical protein